MYTYIYIYKTFYLYIILYYIYLNIYISMTKYIFHIHELIVTLKTNDSLEIDLEF